MAHSDPYEDWKEQGRPGGSYEAWLSGQTTAATDAPQKQNIALPQTAQPAEQKAGIGGPGWNEDFDQAWARRVLDNSQLKDAFGLSDTSSLRDEETRRQINRWLREHRGSGSDSSPAAAGATTAAAAVPAAGKPASTTGTGAGAKAPTQPTGTTGKATVVSGKETASAQQAPSSGHLILGGVRPPMGLVYGNTVVPAAGGSIPALQGPWWPSYPPGNAAKLAVRPGTASAQAAALTEQRGT